MRRILLSSALLILISQTALAMNTEKKLLTPTPRTRAYVERALKALEIPLESVKIYGFHDGHSKTGWANSDSKVIAINENMAELFKEWLSFHEAAHIKDEYSRKVLTYPKYETGLFASICSGAYLLLHKTKTAKTYINSRPLKMLTHSAYSLFATGSAYFFYKNIAVPYEQEQGEIRADKIAIEKLIALNNLNPILYYLLTLKKLEHDNIKSDKHPPAAQEYKATKKILEDHGFKVTKNPRPDIPNHLMIEISKNGKNASIQAGGFYSKV